VAYPKLYADGDSEKAFAFNCAQRAHQNVLEQMPIWLAAQAALALMHPYSAGVLGFLWMTGAAPFPRFCKLPALRALG
jgi:glutathione S-transferase